MEKTISPEEVYIAFRKAQSQAKNRPYRLPKDWDTFYKNRMSKSNRENLELITGFFNTKWKNIDPFRYFSCGFELYKSFTYAMFFRSNIINLYMRKDKHLKRDLNNCKKGMISSLKFVKEFMNKKEIPNINRYCGKKVDRLSLPIRHYLKNNIDKFFIVFLIRYGYLQIDDDERSVIPYVVENYREIITKFEEIPDFILKIKEKM